MGNLPAALLRHRYRAGTRSDGSPRLGIPLQPLQVGSHFRRALVAQIAVFLQGLVDDVFQLGRNITIETNGRGWNRIEDCLEDDSRTFAMKGQNTCRHLVQHSAEGEQIAPRIQLFRPHLLRRHVRHGAHHRARTGQMLRLHRLRIRDAIWLEELPAGLTFASPKSRIFACPRLVTKMLAGLMSRWTMFSA